MRNKIVAGNWKMHLTKNESIKLVQEIEQILPNLATTQVMVAPTFINLEAVANQTKNAPITVAAQNMHQASSGAFTGEISAEMLKDIAIQTVILGHSERRTFFGETNETLFEKVNTAIGQEMTIVFCFGEQLIDRENNQHFSVIKEQVSKALFHLTPSDWKNIVLAYEPVWAIGTGKTASPEQAQEMHAFIRNIIKEQYNAELANQVQILYGGSVKPENAKEIFGKPDVDGGLIGGAALKPSDFVAIIKAAL